MHKTPLQNPCTKPCAKPYRPIWHGYNDGNSNTLVLLDKDDPVPEGDIPVYEDHDDLLRAGERVGRGEGGIGLGKCEAGELGEGTSLSI